MKVTLPIDEILARARAFGATLAGVVAVRAVMDAPSMVGLSPLRLPRGARSVLVLGLAHPEHEPELDWWGGKGGTPGNRILQRVARKLEPWLAQDLGVAAWSLPYHVERGGIFLKDAAVLAGLGALGANNLVISPEFGPRVRWKAMLLDREAPATVGGNGSKDIFDPCAGCGRPCMEACRQGAFSSGRYERSRCERQMHRDEERAAAKGPHGSDGLVKYCRACELACPVGGRRALRP